MAPKRTRILYSSCFHTTAQHGRNLSFCAALPSLPLQPERQPVPACHLPLPFYPPRKPTMARSLPSVDEPSSTTTSHRAPSFCYRTSRHDNVLMRAAFSLSVHSARKPIRARRLLSRFRSSRHNNLSLRAAFSLLCKPVRKHVFACRPFFRRRNSRNENLSLRAAFPLTCQRARKPIMRSNLPDNLSLRATISVAVPAGTEPHHGAAPPSRFHASQHDNLLMRAFFMFPCKSALQAIMARLLFCRACRQDNLSMHTAFL